jgi:hypothetical protein
MNCNEYILFLPQEAASSLNPYGEKILPTTIHATNTYFLPKPASEKKFILMYFLTFVNATIYPHPAQ